MYKIIILLNLAMRELVDELKNIELAIFDLDGVIYRGDILISNSDKVIQELKDISIKVVYNSNNSTVTIQIKSKMQLFLSSVKLV